jgi:guanylate cyclase soluble subunit beta
VNYVCNFVSLSRKEADVVMEGQFLVRQIYEDEITYNLIGAAERVLRK